MLILALVQSGDIPDWQWQRLLTYVGGAQSPGLTVGRWDWWGRLGNRELSVARLLPVESR